MRITAKKYIDNQVRWEGKLRKAEVRSIREAVNKVEATNIAKFESQNEWRQQMKDQTNSFVTRRELWAAVITTITILLAGLALIYKK